MSETVTSSNSQATLAAEVARLRDSIRRALDILTASGEDTEAWSPKIAKAVPILRESVK